MSAKYDKFLGILTVSAVILANSALGFAADDIENVTLDVQEDSQGMLVDDGSLNVSDIGSGGNINEREVNEGAIDEGEIDDFESDEDGAVPEMTNLEKQTQFLEKLKEELDMSKSAYRSTLTNIADMEARLDKVDEDTFSLKGQLDNLDKLIATTTAKLFDVLRKTVEVENEVKLLYEQKEIKEVALKYQKELLADYVKVIYEEESNLLSFDENGDVDAFKMLLSDGSVGDNLRELEYFDLLNEAGQQLVEKLEDLSSDLEKYEKRLNKKHAELTDLQGEVEQKKEQLELQKTSKENLLKLTNGQEEIYSELLEQSLKEQEELVLDIKKLDDAINFIETKIQEEGDNFNPDDYMDLLDYKTQVLFDFRVDHDGTSSDFDWPISPEKGISAYFRDPGYAGTFGVRHNAVDLPTNQGTAVRTTASGVVYSAKDNGYGYSYVMVAHANGFMSVYGHISKILVKEGDTVPQGSIIGLSGGMPGTLGAGYMTTGPHLHFEILQNGMHVDPLDYLDLDVFDEDDIDWLPDKYHDKWESDTNFEPVSRF